MKEMGEKRRREAMGKRRSEMKCRDEKKRGRVSVRVRLTLLLFPQFLELVPEPQEASTEINGIAGCAFCGGLGHRLKVREEGERDAWNKKQHFFLLPLCVSCLFSLLHSLPLPLLSFLSLSV